LSSKAGQENNLFYLHIAGKDKRIIYSQSKHVSLGGGKFEKSLSHIDQLIRQFD